MLCVIIIVDTDTTARLTKTEQIAERFGYPPKKVHGHITLATYTGKNEEDFLSSCKEILSGYEKFPVYYDKVEAWTSTPGVKSFIVAVPRMDHAIVTLQKEISQNWTADLNQWTQANQWHPHTSLLHAPGVDLSAVAEAMQAEFEPFTAQIDRIEFTHVFEDENKCSFETVDCIELQ